MSDSEEPKKASKKVLPSQQKTRAMPKVDQKALPVRAAGPSKPKADKIVTRAMPKVDNKVTTKAMPKVDQPKVNKVTTKAMPKVDNKVTTRAMPKVDAPAEEEEESEEEQEQEIIQVGDKKIRSSLFAKDLEMAKKQAVFEELQPKEQEKVEKWAIKQINKGGACPESYEFTRLPESAPFPGWVCKEGGHVIPDFLVVEGKQGVLVVLTKDLKDDTEPWYPDPREGNKGKWICKSDLKEKGLWWGDSDNEESGSDEEEDSDDEDSD